MAKIGKRLSKAQAAFAGKGNLSVEEAMELVKASASAKFDETVEVAIKLGVDAANRQRHDDGLPLLPQWTPNQLRHLRAGELEETLGIEAAGAVLGHAKVETTQIYARRKLQLAIQAARQIG